MALNRVYGQSLVSAVIGHVAGVAPAYGGRRNPLVQRCIGRSPAVMVSRKVIPVDSLFQLQQWLGHANLNTTQIYVHLGKQNAKKIMEQTSLA